MTVLTIILYSQYQAFCYETEKMMALKVEYRAGINVLKKILKKQSGQPLEKKNDNSLLLVNRDSASLKKSMIDYLQNNNLQGEVKRIDENDWVDYTKQVIAQLNKTKNKKNSKPSPQNTRKNNKKKRSVQEINFLWPIEQSKFWLSSFFGPRKKPNGSWGFHYGIDMAALRGTPIKAAERGTIEQAGFVSGYGNTILIAHNKKYKTRYAHLHKILVKKGQVVKKGQRIGLVGDTGFVRKTGKDASHLHFEVVQSGKRVNPILYLV